ncbi:MAG: hypothetical protein MZV70_29665 [Desulfobacterales bacterium]|nr:hypothetical protein [Desulfobacterales bacterium]
MIETLATPVDRAGHYGHEQIFTAHFAETANRRQRAAAVPYSMRLAVAIPRHLALNVSGSPSPVRESGPWHRRGAGRQPSIPRP